MDLRNNEIGIYEKAMPNAFSWEEKITVAKEAGFNFIEISVDESKDRLDRLDYSIEERQAIKKLLDDNNMYFKSMCLSGHRKYPFGSLNEETRKHAYEIMDKAIDLALDLGVENIQLAGYDVYYEDSNDKTLELFVEGLKYASKKATEKGVKLSIEVMDTWLCGTITRVLEFIDKVGSKNLLVYPDLGNLTQWTNDPELELEKGIDSIVAIHLKDTLPGVFKCVPFCDGTVRFTDLFNKLRDLDYKQPFLIEMWADNDKTYTIEESINELKTAKTWLYNRM